MIKCERGSYNVGYLILFIIHEPIRGDIVRASIFETHIQDKILILNSICLISLYGATSYSYSALASALSKYTFPFFKNSYMIL